MSELGAKNRRVIAERCGWPDKAVETCEGLDAAHPGWSTSWMPANNITGWERPAGYCAALVDGPSLVGGDQLRRLPEDGVPRGPAVFATTVEELEELMAGVEGRVEMQRLADERLHEALRRGRRSAR